MALLCQQTPFVFRLYVRRMQPCCWVQDEDKSRLDSSTRDSSSRRKEKKRTKSRSGCRNEPRRIWMVRVSSANTLDQQISIPKEAPSRVDLRSSAQHLSLVDFFFESDKVELSVDTQSQRDGIDRFSLVNPALHWWKQWKNNNDDEEETFLILKRPPQERMRICCWAPSEMNSCLDLFPKTCPLWGSQSM